MKLDFRNIPQGYKPNPIYVETKSKRLQLLMQPSLYTRLKNRADAMHTSINDLVNTILKNSL